LWSGTAPSRAARTLAARAGYHYYEARPHSRGAFRAVVWDLWNLPVTARRCALAEDVA